MTLKLNRVCAVVDVHVHAKYHHAESNGLWVIVYASFLPYFALVKNPIIRLCDLDIWPVTLKFPGFRAVVKEHVRAKFHGAVYKWSKEKKTPTKTIQSVATARRVIVNRKVGLQFDELISYCFKLGLHSVHSKIFSRGLTHLTLKLTELTPGHWFFATPMSLGFSVHVSCPSHLLRTVSSTVLRCGHICASGPAGPPSAFSAVRPTTFSKPTFGHSSFSDIRAVWRFSAHDRQGLLHSKLCGCPVFAVVKASVRPSVRLSVTLLHCVNTMPRNLHCGLREWLW